ncbi:hypothetical protein LTR37_011094 [Vermiconidia calcicola]|uniref:Uncharacterized protein n=1 Tax=Vermiconidia calcicola TaxID=1690605 RepID=A0ACC3N4R6_9PEZI|nr:hypothetical protein LTR37_011094 [Vermiconidia calcicola]
MTTQEPSHTRQDIEDPDHALKLDNTKDSDNSDDLQLEAASIASALDGEPFETSGEHDLEKVPTEVSHNSYEPATRIATATDWTGPDDKDNPLTWPLWKKAYHTLASGSLAFAVTAGSSLITPGIPQIAEEFGVSRTASVCSLTVFVLGLACGPVIAAPISETYGRSIVYKISAPVYILFLVGAGFSKSFAGHLVCRLLAGTVGAPVLAVGAGTSADVYPQHNRAVATATFIMMPFLGPSLGPVIGGFAAQYKGWRWTQWCTIFIGIFALALKLGIPGPPKPPVKGWAYVKLLVTITLVRPVHMLLTEPIVIFLSLYNSFTFSVLFAFFAAYPYTFQLVYDFETWEYGLTFLGILVGVLLAVLTAIVVDRTVYIPIYKQVLAQGKTAVAPEHRLYIAMVGAFGIPIGLFWFAWTARRDVHWISPVLAGIPFAWGNLALFISSALYLTDVYGPLNGASAMAANGLARYTMGAVFPLFTFQMYEVLGIAWASSLLGFISVAMIPIPWVFFKWGPSIRARSSYDTLKV